MSALMLTDGLLFAGRYRIGRCIAVGGMGAVYEVVHLETERKRALKIMHPHLVQSDELRDRFRLEARVAAHIDSDFIVDVFDAGVDEATGMPFLVMELLRGEELGKRLKRSGPIPPSEAVRYLWQTALALDKTHKANIVHRDLKPENLFLAEREDGPPRVKVLDFGIAKFVAEGGTQANATKSIGTPLYMAPEQFRPKSKVSSATDIYSLGMVAYTLLVGTPYWDEERSSGENVYAILATVMHGPQEPPSARAARSGGSLPLGFDAWFARVTALRPEDRFTSATAAVQELAQVLDMPTPGIVPANAVDIPAKRVAIPADLQTGGQSLSGLGSTKRIEVSNIKTTREVVGDVPADFVEPHVSQGLVTKQLTHRMLAAMAVTLLVGGMVVSIGARNSRLTRLEGETSGHVGQAPFQQPPQVESVEVAPMVAQSSVAAVPDASVQGVELVDAGIDGGFDGGAATKRTESSKRKVNPAPPPKAEELWKP